MYFEQPALRNQTSQTGILHVAILDSAGAAKGQPFLNNFYDKISIRIDGREQIVTFDLIKGEDATPEDLAEALQEAFDAQLPAYKITATLHTASFMVPEHPTDGAQWNAGYYIELKADGYPLEEGGWGATGISPSDSSIQTRQTPANTSGSDLVTSTVVLDYVGKGSTGGDLVIGGQSTGDTSTSKGVQQFEITVERDSKLEVISSTNNTLQVVNLVNSGAYNYLGAYERDSNKGERSGDLSVLGYVNTNTAFGAHAKGPYETPDDTTVNVSGGGNPPNTNGNQTIDGATPAQNNGYGFTDVRVIDGSAFKGNLALSALLTRNVVAKYLDIKDPAPALANADNKSFDYTLGSGNDKLDLAISAANLDVAGSATREDFVLNVNAGAGNDEIRVGITNDAGANFPSGNGANWYANQSKNGRLNIDAGAGDDVVRTPGSGNYAVNLGAGSDTYYADNTANKATWVFNTAQQANVAFANANRVVDDLNSDTIASFAYAHGFKLQVSYTDVARGTFEKVVDIPERTGGLYGFSDLEINQAIKNAIDDDPVLSKLLAAEDGPAGVLRVRALSDGAHAVSDLAVSFVAPTTSQITQAGLDSLKAAVKAAGNGAIVSFETVFGKAIDSVTLTDWQTYLRTTLGTQLSDKVTAGGTLDDYLAAFEVGQTGANSNHVSDNVITGGAGDDILVLSTGWLSNDRVRFTESMGSDTLVNFAQVTTPGTSGQTAVITVNTWSGGNNLQTTAGKVASAGDTVTLFFTLTDTVSGDKTVFPLESNPLTRDVTTSASIAQSEVLALFNGKRVTIGGVEFEVSSGATVGDLRLTALHEEAFPPAGQTLSVTVEGSDEAHPLVNTPTVDVTATSGGAGAPATFTVALPSGGTFPAVVTSSNGDFTLSVTSSGSVTLINAVTVPAGTYNDLEALVDAIYGELASTTVTVSGLTFAITKTATGFTFTEQANATTGEFSGLAVPTAPTITVVAAGVLDEAFNDTGSATITSGVNITNPSAGSNGSAVDATFTADFTGTNVGAVEAGDTLKLVFEDGSVLESAAAAGTETTLNHLLALFGNTSNNTYTDASGTTSANSSGPWATISAGATTLVFTSSTLTPKAFAALLAEDGAAGLGLVLENGTDGAALVGTAGITPANALTNGVAASPGGLGVDVLDFSAFGANAVYFGNNFNANGFGATASVGALGGNLPSGVTYTGGQKYITLEQVNTASDPSLTGKYEIRLWQDDTGSTSKGTADFDNANHLDTDLGLIGYADFGQVLSAAYFTAPGSVIL